ncbi:unnamed protein product [Mytilus coruscus]|uniref:CCHC-type domain-containing protein n=1 Tax=Mytilus coruscus TaxID=42192 RepID=A0A6J8EFU9_MYTCO|nr:unnamed protein product [Mytilus coruscus]
MDQGEPQRITIVTETRNLRSQPFIASDDQISTGKQWEEWLESIEREFRYFRITEPEDKKDALIIYGGKDIARLERSLRNEEGEDEYKILKNKLNKCYVPKGTSIMPEVGQMEDTCLQMKDMKGDHSDYSISSANKIQSNRSSNRAQDFKEDRFQQNGRNMMTNANCSYCGFDHGDERRCPAYGKQCKNCDRYNHLASLCRAEKKEQVGYNSQQQNRSVNYRNRRNVKKTTEEAYETDSNTDTSDYEEDEDYFGETIKHIMENTQSEDHTRNKRD